MIQRLVSYWVYGGFLAAFLLIGILPVCSKEWSLAFLMIYLQLPVYMIHQLEEHDNDRFRLFINEVLAGGREVLSPITVFIINVPGVWGVNLLSILMAFTFGLGYGLIGIYLTLVNALVHIAQALHLKRYNPGLATAICLFVPFGGFALWSVIATRSVSISFHLLGFATALAVHLRIVVYVLMEYRKVGMEQKIAP